MDLFSHMTENAEIKNMINPILFVFVFNYPFIFKVVKSIFIRTQSICSLPLNNNRQVKSSCMFVISLQANFSTSNRVRLSF